jgi:hypothetical protein
MENMFGKMFGGLLVVSFVVGFSRTSLLSLLVRLPKVHVVLVGATSEGSLLSLLVRLPGVHCYHCRKNKLSDFIVVLVGNNFGETSRAVIVVLSGNENPYCGAQSLGVGPQADRGDEES